MEDQEPKNAYNSLRIKRLDAIYGRVLEVRNFEIQNLNTRNTFISAANIGFFAFAAKQTEASYLLIIFGFVVSFLQTQMAAGAKYWQEVWEHKLSDTERKLYQIYIDENKSNPTPDPFIHLFTPENMDGYANNEVINDEFYERQRHEIREIMREKLQTNSLFNKFLNKIIFKKYSVSRTPIYLGVVMMVFWSFLFLKLLLCE